MQRRRIYGAALALSIAGAMMVTGGQAFAASGPKGKTACSTVTGTVTGTVTVSGCFGTANTGSHSQPLATSSLLNGGTITWVTGKTTTFSAPVLATTNAKKCPGYVKGGSNNPTADKFAGVVTADTSGMKVPGKFKGAVCISPAGNITALKALKVN
jgi:hypothetical protein